VGESLRSPSMRCSCPTVGGVEDGMPHDVLHFPRASA
jgi:hypothetical protein